MVVLGSGGAAGDGDALVEVACLEAQVRATGDVNRERAPVEGAFKVVEECEVFCGSTRTETQRDDDRDRAWLSTIGAGDYEASDSRLILNLEVPAS